MKNLLFIIITYVSLSTLTFGQTLNDEQIYKALKEKYKYESLVFDNDQTENLGLLKAISADDFIKKNIKSISDLDFKKASVITWKDGRKSYMVPLISNSNKPFSSRLPTIIIHWL